ncbi:MAG: hypothetical protein JWQ42_3664 [Edaphobacter sp.]|nr:hypothetical protein [Edaphobacter sp.]
MAEQRTRNCVLSKADGFTSRVRTGRGDHPSRILTPNGTNVLRDAVTLYKKVDTDAIASKVKQEFAAKTKAKKEAKPVLKAKKAA